MSRKRRANLNALLKPYLDKGHTMEDLITEGTPDGGVRIYVKATKRAQPEPRPATEPKTDWSNAPAFE